MTVVSDTTRMSLPRTDSRVRRAAVSSARNDCMARSTRCITPTSPHRAAVLVAASLPRRLPDARRQLGRGAGRIATSLGVHASAAYPYCDRQQFRSDPQAGTLCGIQRDFKAHPLVDQQKVDAAAGIQAAVHVGHDQYRAAGHTADQATQVIAMRAADVQHLSTIELPEVLDRPDLRGSVLNLAV